MNQISPLAFVHPEAKLGDNNIIGPFCYIEKNTVIGDNNVMQNSVTINYGARIGNNNEFFPGASISTKPQDLKFKGEESLCQIGDSNSIRENVTISRGTASKGITIVGNNNLLMENMHVAHDCVLGSRLIIGNSTKFGGEVVIDDDAIISATVLTHQFCHIGGFVMIQGGSKFSKDIPPYIIAGKDFGYYCGVNLIGLRRHGFSNELINNIHEAYRLLYSKGIIEEGIQEIQKNIAPCKEIDYIIDFVRSSQRGIVRPLVG
jgi:UDP-N-acetylglucosamine acyltransferase